MEFCQIQLNYLDWTFQDAKGKVELLNEYKLPVWVMEPLRGGNFAKLPKEEEMKLTQLRPEETIPGWAFRFLQAIPEVTMILSGMSNMDQMEANVKTFETEEPLNKEEMELLTNIGMKLANGVPCTGCSYCTEYCPQNLEIPMLIHLYNEHVYTNGGYLACMKMEMLEEDKRPGSCLGCRSCEAVCPQGIKISEVMADYAKKISS